VPLKAAQAEPAAMAETLRHTLAHLAPAAASAAPTAAKAGTAEDEAAVRAVLQDYMDGTYEGDVDKLKACFHPAVNPPHHHLRHPFPFLNPPCPDTALTDGRVRGRPS